MECFHACEKSGGESHVRENAPFKSTNKDLAWLGTGYYFWFQRLELAKSWGRASVKGSYAIIRADIQGYEDVDLLDLVGSPTAIMYFKKLHEDFLKQLEAGGDDSKPTVSACINYYRKLEAECKGVFPFKLIRAADQNESIKKKIQFIDDDAHEHTIALNDRQQVCVFEEGLDFIENKIIVYPVNWNAYGD